MARWADVLGLPDPRGCGVSCIQRLADASGGKAGRCGRTGQPSCGGRPAAGLSRAVACGAHGLPSQAQTACTAAMEEDLRLIGGDIATEGLVRICHNGDWQHVVDDRWDLITGLRNDRRYVGSRAWATVEMESTQQGALRARCSGSVVPRVTDRQAFLPDYETRFTREPRHRETKPVKENFAVSPQFRGGPRDCMQTILTQRVVV